MEQERKFCLDVVISVEALDPFRYAHWVTRGDGLNAST